jgi:curli biogenesis system outer membrane secretion channel CsgG
MKTPIPLRAMLVASIGFLIPATGFAQKETLGVMAIRPTPSLTQAVAKAGKSNSLGRVVESLDGQLIDRLNATRKFELLARSDLKDVLREQSLAASGNLDALDKNTAKQFKLAGAKYILVATLDDFQDFSETATFQGTGTSATKRAVRLSTIGKIYDATSGKLLESANFQLSNKDISENRSYSTKDGELSDELLVAIAREMADRLANRVADVIFPAKVLVRRDKQLTINRGDGTGVAVDQVWNVYAVGEELIDPDTKESLGKEEVLVGKAKIVSVQPKTATAEVLEDTGIDKGAILRLPPTTKKLPTP